MNPVLGVPYGQYGAGKYLEKDAGHAQRFTSLAPCPDK